MVTAIYVSCRCWIQQAVLGWSFDNESSDLIALMLSKADSLLQEWSTIMGNRAFAVSTHILLTFEQKSPKFAAEWAEDEDCCAVLTRTFSLDHRAFVFSRL